ncbi:MAG: pyridoxal phosphate-dependent aminotransferase, partial [Dehalococcoidales bacterium]|nr:pyridoxal phosphate-dependent aminotransferase [Dehalococcoidales bacterium]
MPISDRVKKNMSQGSWIRRMFEEGTLMKQKYGAENVFDLTLGNPVMEPPKEFNMVLRDMVNNPVPGMHRYMENAGFMETRDAVAKQLSIEAGMKFTGKDIVMTCGAAGALNTVFKTLLDPGDEVIVFAPFFAEFTNYIDNHDGVPVIVPTDENFIPRLDMLEKAITAKTRVVLTNSPNNPTGVMYSHEFWDKLGDLLEMKSKEIGRAIVHVNDEAYAALVFDGEVHNQVWKHYDQTITITSHSKDLALPGERIGYVAVNPNIDDHDDIVNGVIHCNRILGYVNAGALMQKVVAKLQSVTVSILEYQKKRDLLFNNLTQMGYSVVRPQGAFYLFPKSPLED